jgi:hypothetical protein
MNFYIINQPFLNEFKTNGCYLELMAKLLV